MNIELHIEKVQSLLDQMDIQKKCKFAAWCCNALIIDKKINANMTKITNSKVCRFRTYFPNGVTTELLPVSLLRPRSLLLPIVYSLWYTVLGIELY